MTVILASIFFPRFTSIRAINRTLPYIYIYRERERERETFREGDFGQFPRDFHECVNILAWNPNGKRFPGPD